MYRLFLVIFVNFVFAEESFITSIEYGKMLYENPRGIGCVECHGQAGEGRMIAEYYHKKKAISLQGPAINHLKFEVFAKALQESKKVMPKYYLTKNEIQAIFEYIESKNSTK
ncbi:c-type cytochrome [Helicobacter mesocricetorum]|uniref:c-type cytochrome n=1 Tax=Helicobacter mesocricetorum TaxID=87012 RepID=UPI000CF09BC7|nr:c-type cytochrome [Helicobacter mesocricetorum]